MDRSFEVRGRGLEGIHAAAEEIRAYLEAQGFQPEALSGADAIISNLDFMWRIMMECSTMDSFDFYGETLGQFAEWLGEAVGYLKEGRGNAAH